MTYIEALERVEKYSQHIDKIFTHKETGSIDRVIDVKIIPSAMKNMGVYRVPNKNNVEYQSILANTDCSIVFIIHYGGYPVNVSINEENMERSYNIKLE